MRVRHWLSLAAAVVLAAAAPWVAPPAWDALRHVVVAHDPAALSELHLERVPAEAYVAGVERALRDGDHDLAQSFVALADARGIAVPADLRDQALAGPSVAAQASDAWAGFKSGTGDSAAALAGAVTADLVGFGDVRDLVREGRVYLAGGEVDGLTVGLAAAGIGLTGALIVSAGTATPARLGVSTLKVAQRTGRLTAPFRRNLARLASNAVDPDGLKATVTALEAGRFGAARAAARGVLKADGVAALRTVAGEFGATAKALGPRGTMQALALAETSRDVSRLSRVAAGFGRGTRAVLTLLGGAALTLGSMAMTVTGWLFAALLWALALTRVLARLIAWLLPPWRRRTA